MTRFFGNILFQFGANTVSRDRLDSINEIMFLEEQLKLSSIEQLTVLDIGAGYGRLAHRVSQFCDNLRAYYCTDGVPYSAFICDYYLHTRNLNKAQVVCMDDAAQELAGKNIHVAFNIHSFSECSIASIDWWIKLCGRLDVKYLFIVPNAYEDEGATLLTNHRQDFLSVIEKNGYQLVCKRPKFSDPAIQQLGLYPTFYYLFKKA